MIKKPDAQIPNHSSLKTDRHTKMNTHELLHEKWAGVESNFKLKELYSNYLGND